MLKNFINEVNINIKVSDSFNIDDNTDVNSLNKFIKEQFESQIISVISDFIGNCKTKEITIVSNELSIDDVVEDK